MDNPNLRNYQHERIANIRNWYQWRGNPHRDNELDTSVQYLLAWTAFNALYNIADMPNRKLRTPDQRTGHPRIRRSTEHRKLREIARRLAKDEEFIQTLYLKNRNFCEEFTKRKPRVTQPNLCDEIPYQVDGEDFIVQLKEIRGVASLDNRVILRNGYKIFEYTSLKIIKKKDGTLKVPRYFIRQLIFVLYQIRNNVAHGGSAAFFSRGNKVSEGAIKVLDEIVNHILKHRDILIPVNE